MTKIKKKDRSLFEYQERMEKIKAIKTPLDKLNEVIDWEIFRPVLNEILAPKEVKGPGGAPHYDYVFMFKILILQRYYNFSDAQTEFRINDTLSFQRFLGITLSDLVPDQNKIWDFRERLKKNNAIDRLFKLFDEFLERKGIIGQQGSIVDASFVEVPRQRNSREENKTIKEGKIPEHWKSNKHKLSHKDTDASWATKNGEKHYGFKNNIKVDVGSKIVREYTVTTACVHDSQALEELLDEKDKHKPLYGDKAFAGKNVAKILEDNEIINQIHEKGYRNKQLTKEQKENNKRKSKIRVRVEHIFAFQENSMGGNFIRTIGKERAKVQIGLMNLVYNLARYAQIVRLGIKCK